MDEKRSFLADIIRQILEDLDADIVEERVVEYIERGLHEGRELRSLLADPYITNRIGEDKVARLIEENPSIIEAAESRLKTAFEKKDFRFTE